MPGIQGSTVGQVPTVEQGIRFDLRLKHLLVESYQLCYLYSSLSNHFEPEKKAAHALKRIQEKCGAKAAGLESLSKLLADPLFQQLLNLENALEKVKNEIRTNPAEFPDYTLDNNGRLVDLNPEQTDSGSEEDSSDNDIHDDGKVSFSYLKFIFV